MARLPNPGADDGTWGALLNDFLQIEHNADGTLKAGGSLALKADNTLVVHNTGNETIAGIKSFSSAPIIPTPTNPTDAVNKTYVDTADATKVTKNSLVFNVRDYGAVGNGVADDTTKIQNTINAAQAAGGGIVYFPAGTYLVTPTSSPALSVTSNGINLLGASRSGSIIKKSAPGTLLSLSGPATDLSGLTHVRFSTVQNLGFDGNGKSGLILRLYYAGDIVLRDLFITGNADICIDTVEFWDSRFENLAIESCGGSANTSTPNILIRNSAAASGFGYSSDSTNQIHINNCRLEGFTTGALWVQSGISNTDSPNGIYINDCKMETSSLSGGPIFKVADTVLHMLVNGLYIYVGGFANGYSTAQNTIEWAAASSVLENVLIANGNVATINAGLELYTGEASVVRNVIGRYTTSPVGPHIYFSGGTGEYVVENSYGNLGAQTGGTTPKTFSGMSPIRSVNGVVTDASFAHTPIDGTLAMDATNRKLYVRIAGTWRSVTLT